MFIGKFGSVGKARTSLGTATSSGRTMLSRKRTTAWVRESQRRCSISSFSISEHRKAFVCVVSAEAFVERGLENALNIDRESFVETDVESASAVGAPFDDAPVFAVEGGSETRERRTADPGRCGQGGRGGGRRDLEAQSGALAEAVRLQSSSRREGTRRETRRPDPSLSAEYRANAKAVLKKS